MSRHRQLVKPHRPRIVIRPPPKPELLDQPRRPLRRDRHRMIRVPVGRQRRRRQSPRTPADPPPVRRSPENRSTSRSPLPPLCVTVTVCWPAPRTAPTAPDQHILAARRFKSNVTGGPPSTCTAMRRRRSRSTACPDTASCVPSPYTCNVTDAPALDCVSGSTRPSSSPAPPSSRP